MGRTLCISDLHGNLNLYKQIINYLNPNDTLYILGDCGDRKPDGWIIIKDALCNTQIRYIKGNHEDMLVDAMRDYTQYDIMDYSWYLLASNGGADTFQGWLEDGANSNWTLLLDKLPLELRYVNKNGLCIIMSHAGFTPKTAEEHKKDDLLWDRQHISDHLDTNKWKNYRIIHGHTPISHMIEKCWKPKLDMTNSTVCLYYADGIKINLDAGTAHTNEIGLLNLDTFEIVKFKSTET